MRSHVTLYHYAEQASQYPMIQSMLDENERPIGFGALSGLAADPEQAGILYAVNDSFYRSQPTIFTIDARQTPAQITAATRVTRDGAPAQLLDMEGITSDGKGGFWIASEGRADRLVPHALYHVNSKGEIKDYVPFPSELLAVAKRFAAEGITLIDNTLWIAIQREWQDDEKGFVKLLSYNLESEAWGYVHYPLETAERGWVGLSEITAYGDYVYIIERDNQIGANAQIKRLYRVAISDLQPVALGDAAPVVSKELYYDFLPTMQSFGGYVMDKIEGFAIDAAGNGYAVTDNDGVDDSNGETLFFSIGQVE